MMFSSFFIPIRNVLRTFQDFLQMLEWNDSWIIAILGLALLSSQVGYYLMRRYFLKRRKIWIQLFFILFFNIFSGILFISLFIYSLTFSREQLGFVAPTSKWIDVAIIWVIGGMLPSIIELIGEGFWKKYRGDKENSEALARWNRSFRGLVYSLLVWTTLVLLGFIKDPLFLSGFGLLIGGFILYNLSSYYDSFVEKLRRKGHMMTYIFVKASYEPLKGVVSIEIAYLIFRILGIYSGIPSDVVDMVSKINSMGLLLLLLWFFFQLIGLFEEQLPAGNLTKKPLDRHKIQVISKLLRIGIIVFFTLFALPILGIPVSGIVTFGGGSAIVVGIAVQPILANYFGGMLIYSDRFFKEGDWILSPDKSLEGTVEKIGWRSTLIRTFDQRPLYVPNGSFASISVINASRMRNRRIQETIGIRYTDASILGKVTDQIRIMLESHPEIDQNRTLLVHFTEFGPSSLNINVYTFTKTRDWKKYRDVQQDVFLKIIGIIEEHGAKLALPHRTVNLEGDKGISPIEK